MLTRHLHLDISASSNIQNVQHPKSIFSTLTILSLESQSWKITPSLTGSSNLGPGATISVSSHPFFILIQAKMIKL